VASRLRAADVHVLLETCGQFGWPGVEAHLLPHVSTWYLDLKLADPGRHRRATGHGNERIHANLARLVAAGADVHVRVPLIPGITDDAENLLALAAKVRALGLPEVTLLPYHPLFLEKRTGLGWDERTSRFAHDRFLPEEQVARCRVLLEGAGLEVR
jgi:pyruvate formate lyase activating enzyme